MLESQSHTSQTPVKIPPLKAGRYVAAISGGVDSMALLHMLAGMKHISVIVAHLDHGIRSDSAQDYTLVRDVARSYGLAFYGARVSLGSSASEAVAREVRYDFLRSVANKTSSQRIITAHHQDDMVETIALQLLRGTNRKGLTPLNAEYLLRPLLDIPKKELVKYAVQHELAWREDSTNQDTAYARNRLRHGALATDSANQFKQDLLSVHRTMLARNTSIDTAIIELDTWLLQNGTIVRWKFAQLPHAVAKNYIAYYLKNRGVEFDATFIERVVVALKVQKPNSRVSVGVDGFIEIGLKTAQLLVQ
jgi:tRNA(Ile)-lysidine synthase